MKAFLYTAFYAAAVLAGAADENGLTLRQTVALPGVKGRFDHFSIDAKGQRLFVAALGNNTVEVIDVAAGERVHSISGLRKPTGVVYLPSTDQIGVANGDDGTFRVYDGERYALDLTVRSLGDADNVRFDAKANRIYVGYGDGALAVIDPAAWKVPRPVKLIGEPESVAKLFKASQDGLTGTIKLAGHPESFQLAIDGPRIWVNVPDARQVAVIDREKRTVTATWPMEKFRANFPMALDEGNRRLFIGCREPARLVVMDTESGKAVADLAISGDTDDLFYDAKERRVYVSCGEGFVDVVDQQSADAYKRRGRIATRAGARTSFFSKERGELYVAVPQRGNEPAEIRIFEVAK